MPIRKMFVAAALAIGCLSACDAKAQSPAADWPSHPIKFVVPASAGGSSDAVARILADGLSKVLGQSVVVTNVPGTASILGFANVAHAAPDGYTILIGSASIVIVPAMRNDLPYAPAELTPVSQLTTSGHALVVNAKAPPAATLPDFVKLIKEKPGVINYGSSGVGSTPHLMVSLFMMATGTQMTHIPFKSSGESVNAILGNEVQTTIDAMPSVLPDIQSGLLKALAVATPTRAPELPDVPAIKEFYPDFPPADQWLGLFTRTGTPQPIIDKLNAAVKQALQMPEIVKRLANAGSRPVGSTPQEFAARLKTDSVTWSNVIKTNNIKSE